MRMHSNDTAVFPKVFLLLQDIQAGNRKNLPDQTENNWQSQRYLQNVNNFVLVVFDQLIPVILSADKTMKRQRMILFPRASRKTFN